MKIRLFVGLTSNSQPVRLANLLKLYTDSRIEGHSIVLYILSWSLSSTLHSILTLFDFWI